MAVRGGFEPPVTFKGYNALAKRRFRPLSHLTFLRCADFKVGIARVKSILPKAANTLAPATLYGLACAPNGGLMCEACEFSPNPFSLHSCSRSPVRRAVA